MFGSITNWVSDNVPKPTMPTMPTMPTVNMPAMPTVNMPGIFNKSKDAPVEGAEGVSENPITENKDTGAYQVETITVENLPEDGEVKSGPEGELTEEETKNGYKPLESAKKMGENMGNMGKNMGENMGNMGKNMGNMLFSFGSKATSSIGNATTSLKDVIQKKTIIGDFSKENEKFINEKKNQQRKEDAAVAPWVGYNEEEKLKEQIIGLSADSRNFLRPPPSGVEFQFDFNLAYPIAMAILDEDPALSEMRFKLVPKQVKEENFWLNYFYRVSLIKQSTTLEELAKQNEKEEGKESNVSKNTNLNTSTKQETNIEFVSDSYDHADNFNEEDIKNELKQLNLDSKKEEEEDDLDDAEWDLKPEDMENISPEELEKEINSMLG